MSNNNKRCKYCHFNDNGKDVYTTEDVNNTRIIHTEILNIETILGSLG